MPVEIKELVIRAIATTDSKDEEDLPQKTELSDDREAIIQACVKQVLKILKKKKER